MKFSCNCEGLQNAHRELPDFLPEGELLSFRPFERLVDSVSLVCFSLPFVKPFSSLCVPFIITTQSLHNNIEDKMEEEEVLFEEEESETETVAITTGNSHIGAS